MVGPFISAVATIALVAACGAGGGDNADTTRLVELLPGDSSGMVVVGGDTAASMAQSATTGQSKAASTQGKAATSAATKSSAPPPPPPLPPTGEIAAGTSMVLISETRVCTNTHKVGDKFIATIVNEVRGTNGAVLPPGSEATVLITSLNKKTSVTDRVEMGFAVSAIEVGSKSYAMISDVTAIDVEQVRSTDNKDVQKVVGGAVIGAILGQIIGKDTKSTVIGAASGTVAGTVVAMAAGDYEGCVPERGKITIALRAPLTIAAGE